VRNVMHHRHDDEEPADRTPVSLLKFGQRNILYIGFVTLLVPFGMALDGPRPAGAQSLGGIAFALMLCGTVSAGFFLINAGLIMLDLAKGRRIAKAVIGCALPLVFGVGAVMVRRLAM
jgi:hypothetical protein